MLVKQEQPLQLTVELAVVKSREFGETPLKKDNTEPSLSKDLKV